MLAVLLGFMLVLTPVGGAPSAWAMPAQPMPAPAVHVALPPGESPFAIAAVAPEDVTFMLRIRGLAQLRGKPVLQGARGAMALLVQDRMASVAWEGICQQMEMDSAALLDMVAGRDITYLERPREGGVEWVLISRMEQGEYEHLVERLKPTMHGKGQVAFNTYGLTAAWRRPWFIIGPAAHPALVEHVLRTVDAPPPAASPEGSPEGETFPAGSLMADPNIRLAAQWPAAPLELVMRTAGSGEDLTVATIAVEEHHLALRHRSRFTRPPIHVAPGEPADAGLLAPFADDSLAVFAMNPWRGAFDPAEPVDALLLEGRVDEAMRANHGARQLLVVDERTVPETAMRAPSLGLAIEVRDPVLAEAQWDGWARRLTVQLASRAGKQPPEIPEVPSGQPRQATVGELIRDAFADHPLARTVDICWMTIQTPNGAWQLLATDRQLLDRMVARIGGAARAPVPEGWHEVGTVRTAAMAEHLRSWMTQARAFQPEAPETFNAGVRLAAGLVGVAHRVDWRARAPEEKIIEGELVLHLRPPEPPPSPPTPPAEP